MNGEKISVSGVGDLNHAMLATGFAYNVRETSNNNLDHFQKFLMKAQAIRRDGVAAIDLCYVAAGRYDGFWERELSAWDIAAGILLVREAGGFVSAIREGDDPLEKGALICANEPLFEPFRRIIRGA